MLNKELFEIYKGLVEITPLKGIKLNYAIAKNIALLKDELGPIEKALEALPEFTAFQKERVALCEEYAKRDENGMPMKHTVAGQESYIFAENQKAFEKAFESLKEAHKDTIKAQEEKLEKDREFLSEPTKLVLHTVEMADIPEDVDTDQMKALYPIIK